jgi:hypothetical protein
MQMPSRFSKRILTVMVRHKMLVNSDLKYFLPNSYVFIFIKIYNMASVMNTF